MLTITSAARARLTRKLIHKKAGEDVALRFVRREGGWTLRLDRTQPADLSFDHNGRAVLLLDQAASKAMTDKTLDVRKTQAGARLVLR